MPSSRKVFLGGAAVLGMTGLLSEAAAAAMGERAVMLTLWAKTKDPAGFDKYYTTTHDPLVKHLRPHFI